MKLTAAPIKNQKSKIKNLHRRATAEIELVLVIPLLLTLLFITKGTLNLGESRLRNVFAANQHAYSDAINSAPPQYADNSLQPITGIADVRPGLPNRMHDREETVTVTHNRPIPLKPVELTDHAAYAAPAWSYHAFPVHDAGGAFNDATTTQDWFRDYASEIRAPLEDALGLSPSTPP